MRCSIFFALSFLLFLLLGAPSSAEALVCDAPMGICDDINEVSNGWNAIANALEENAGDDLEDLDVESLVDDVNVLLEATELLGEALVEIGNEDEEELGGDLLDVIDDLYEVEGDDMAAYLVDIIDDIVDALDAIVDYCDEE